MSFLLRHSPESKNLSLDLGGWAKTQDMQDRIKNEFQEDFSYHDLERIVESDEKQRYTITEDKKKIRAKNGHTLKGLELELLEMTPPANLYHGTSGYYNKICDQYKLNL